MRLQSLTSTALAALTLFLGACTSAEAKAEMHEVETAWNAPGKGLQYNKVIVAALTDKADRVALEDQVVAKLKKKGITAVPSHEGWKDLDKTGFARFNQFIKLHDIEAVITIETASAEVVTDKEHAMVMANAGFSEVVEASWTTEEVDDDFVVQVTLWNAVNWKPVWSRRSETVTVTEAGPGGIATFTTTAVVDEDMN
jgi:hypothetical protein